MENKYVKQAIEEQISNLEKQISEDSEKIEKYKESESISLMYKMFVNSHKSNKTTLEWVLSMLNN